MDANIQNLGPHHSANWVRDIPISGPEDVAIDHTAKVAYVSSQDRSAAEWVVWGLLRRRAVDWTQRGCIYKLDLDSARSAPVTMTDDLGAGEGFHPCGIDFLKQEGERDRLFVVNWPASQQFSIEVFEVDGNRLHRVHGATSDKLTLPNDIVAINEHQFYVTNSACGRTPWLQTMEALLRLPTGSVLFHDLATGEWSEIATGIPYANGIAIDRDRGRLYVASAASGKLLAFEWNQDRPSARLSGPQQIELKFLPDNLTWEDEDNLWLAGSEPFLGGMYMFLMRESAPSHVARIRLPEPGAEAEALKPVPVYDDDGGEIAAGSVAAPFEINGECRFIVGACFDDHAIVCRAPRAA